MPREYLRCAQCDPVADAHSASTEGGLMQHLRQKHGGQVLLEDRGGQLRWLYRQACVYCGRMRSQRCRWCNSCWFDTPLLELRVGTPFSLSIRTQGPVVRHLPQCLQEILWTTARFRTAPSGTSSKLIETSSCSPSSAGPRRWHSRGVWSLPTPRLGQKVSKEP